MLISLDLTLECLNKTSYEYLRYDKFKSIIEE